MERWESFDNAKWRSVAQSYYFQAGVRADGTLWLWGLTPPPAGGGFSKQLQQVGKGTDWVDVALLFHKLAALKEDGSLWEWDLTYSQMGHWVLAESPARLGIHSDWIALSSADEGIVSLAADGSLWYWRCNDYFYDQPLLAPSRRPAKITNILDQHQ